MLERILAERCDLLFGEDGFGFDFDEHLGRNEAADFDHGARRSNIFEDFAVGAADGFPVGDVFYEDARADDVGYFRAGVGESRFDILQGLRHLGARVAYADDFAVGIR